MKGGNALALTMHSPSPYIPKCFHPSQDAHLPLRFSMVVQLEF